MIQTLPQSNLLIPNSTNPTVAVESINSYINKYNCETLSVDISFMNILDACYVSTMCSTTHYIKYPNGKINWKISSDLVREYNKNMDLGNTSYV